MPACVVAATLLSLEGTNELVDLDQSNACTPLAPRTMAVYAPAGRWSTSADSSAFGGASAFFRTSIALISSCQLSLLAMAVPFES